VNQCTYKKYSATYQVYDIVENAMTMMSITHFDLVIDWIQETKLMIIMYSKKA